MASSGGAFSFSPFVPAIGGQIGRLSGEKSEFPIFLH